MAKWWPPLKWIKSPLPPSQAEYDEPWRPMEWRVSKQNMLKTLNHFQPGNSEVKTFKILLYGSVGVGKSSIINSVTSSVQGRVCNRVPSNSVLAGESFTLECKTYKLKKGTLDDFYPFTFTDISGIEAMPGGIQTDDIVKILRGHINDDYTFNPVKSISEEDPKYNRYPTLKDRIHCLVSVLSANNISMMEDNVIKQMKEVRTNAKNLGIPEAVIMTKVDEACPLVKENLEKVYTSKKIKEKMEMCCNRLGVPVSYIFPVKNYHEERTTNSTMDTLILDALQNIVNYANDYVQDQAGNESLPT
ncbi:interferon-induced protein 44-like [Triplophysa dalaica]|uniref:interferon-induced protein 44-like n=1 Tax=Triplophysa dalaica TaxID=1582913 RepID=UPI0024E0043D|nr:interferon-induced protein 44-like [Triplophysa dalaica]